MTAISTAISVGRRSRVAGYIVTSGFFQEDTPNLPQVIAILGEANNANQTSLPARREITSAQQAGEVYGFGSPIHQMMRILRPVSGGGVQGVPTVVYAQSEPGGGTARAVEYTVTGTATSSATHTMVINGRESLDFSSYSYSVITGETPTQIAAKISDAINSVQGSPFIASASGAVVTLTSKWRSSTANELKTSVDTGSNTAGVTYAITDTTDATGTVDLGTSLTSFGDDWNTIVLNPYGESKFADLEQVNGVPGAENPTGRYAGRVFRPFVALFGSTESTISTISDLTDDAARRSQVTNVLCPAPNSDGMPWEAAANMATIYAPIAQNTPHLDVNNRPYPDMPVPSDGLIGGMSDYENRDLLVKDGASTVTLENGRYTVQDFVTTYHPAGEVPLQFAYVRNLMIDWNLAFGYKILENRNVRDHAVVNDDQITDATRVVKPSQWRGILFEYYDDLATRALIVDPAFSKENLRVQRSTDNPDRFETFFRYKRSGLARIASTTAEAGF